MERGLIAPLSPHEEVSFRRVALGISKAELLPARARLYLAEKSRDTDYRTKNSATLPP
jgi:hypothetical protein